jgi:hypothetical protein
MLETVYGESAMERRTVKSGSTMVRLTAKKGAQESLKNQDHAHWFLLYLITNLFHRVKKLLPHFTWKFSNVCVNVCDVYDLNCGQKRTGSFITTMHPHTRRLLCMSFFAKNDMITMDRPSYSPNLAP